MKPSGWIGLLVIVAALGMGARAFITNLTPYVTFADARKSKTAVQVMGKLDKKSIAYNGSQLEFTLVSENGEERMPVVFKAQRPANFEQAIQITAIGSYDGDTFQAKNLLVKCPTKYQGTDTETKSYGAS